jgi:hypothetical protein
MTALALSNVVSKGLMFGWQLILARLLGAAGYGTYGTIGALLAIGAAIPEFGIGLICCDVAKRPATRALPGCDLTLQPVLAAGYAGDDHGLSAWGVFDSPDTMPDCGRCWRGRDQPAGGYARHHGP